MPWITLFAFAVLSVQMHITGSLSLAPTMACIPLAVFMGHRYGIRGLVTVVIAGIFLVLRVEFETIRLGGHASIYLLALMACIVAQRKVSMSDFATAPPSARSLILVPLLSLSVGLWGREVEIFDADFLLSLDISLQLVAYAVLFVFGLRNGSLWRVGIILVVTLIIGLATREAGLPIIASKVLDANHADLPVIGLVDLDYVTIKFRFHSLSAVVAGLLFFGAGRISGVFLRSGRTPAPWVSVLLVIVLLIFSFNVIPFKSGTEAIDAVFHGAWIILMGEQNLGSGAGKGLEEIVVVARRFRSSGISTSYLVIPLLGFMSALLLAYRGIALSLVLVFSAWILESIVGGWFPGMPMNLGYLVSLLSFAALGLAIRSEVLGTPLKWWSGGWATYIVLALVVVVPLGAETGMAFIPLFMLGAILLGMGAARILQWVHGKHTRLHPGWAALLVVIGMVSVLVSNIALIGDAITQLAAGAAFGAIIEELDLLLFGLFALVYTWLLFTALEVLATKLPACLADIRQLYRASRSLIKREPIPVLEDVPNPRKEPSWWYPTRLLRYLRMVTFWLGFVAIVSAGTRAINDEYSDDDDDDRFSDTPITEYDAALHTAALTVFEPWGIEHSERVEGYSSARIEMQTGWFVEDSDPPRRWRAELRIGKNRDDLRIWLDMQTRDYGLWLERSSDWKIERQEAERLTGQVVARAADAGAN